MSEHSIRQILLEQFLYQVSAACDAQEWDTYLSYFAEDVLFHVPQWESEHHYTTDPKREMSLIYYPNRQGLEDRVFRIRTGKSAACTPMPRTLHLINNVRARQDNDSGLLRVDVNWVTHYYRFGQNGLFFGTADYLLEQRDNSFLIKRKHVLLLNDKINAVFDFYHV
ncbi:MAG: anthranilate 1,2-dioxygenase small subunit [Enterobacteriaceae bacterium]